MPRTTTESINEELKPYGFFLVDEYLPGSHTNQTFSCINGHVFERQLDNMRRTVKIGKGCLDCDNLVRRVPVYQYTLNGEYTATFTTLAEVPNLSTAASVTDTVFRNNVRDCILDVANSCQGSTWSFLAPINNKLVRYRDAYNTDELAFIDKYVLSISLPMKAPSDALTGASKKKNLAVLKYDLDTHQILERFETVSAVIAAGNKKTTVYNSCAKFAKNKSIVNAARCKNKQIFIYEDDNQLIPWVGTDA